MAEADENESEGLGEWEMVDGLNTCTVSKVEAERKEALAVKASLQEKQQELQETRNVYGELLQSYEQQYHAVEEETEAQISKLSAQQQKDRDELEETRSKYKGLLSDTETLRKQLEEVAQQQRNMQLEHVKTQSKLTAELEKQRREHQRRLERAQVVFERQLQMELQKEKEKEREKGKEKDKRRRGKQAKHKNKEKREEKQREKEKVHIWKCPMCDSKNDESYRFCPKCSTENELMADLLPKGNLLRIVGSLGDVEKWTPESTKELGWVLQNSTSVELNLELRLSRGGGEESVKIQEENRDLSYNLKPGEEAFVFVHVQAPPFPGSFESSWLLRLKGTDRVVAPPLQLKMRVKAEFSASKEQKVKDLFSLGFNDRTKIVYELNKHKWNVQDAANALMDSFTG